MLTVMIVDDEKWICELIKQSINWEDLGMQVVHTATNGIDALKYLKDSSVDVVITDIRMPGADGIELIKKTREFNEKVFFIIVSGYQDFEYAKSAIQYKVKNYILKPIDEDELSHTLYKISEEINKNIFENNEDAIIKNQLEETFVKLKEQFVRMIVKGDKNYYDSIDFNYKFFVCVIFRIDSNMQDEEMLSQKTLQYITNALYNIRCTVYSFIEESSVICVLNYFENEKIIDILKNCFIDLKILVNSYRQSSITMGIGSVVDHATKIRASYVGADTAVKYRIIVGQNTIIEREKLSFSNSSQNITATQKRNLNNSFETANMQEIEDIIKEIYSAKDIVKSNPGKLFENARIILSLFCEIMKDMKYNADIDSLYLQIEEVTTIQMITEKLIFIINNEFEKKNTMQQQENSKPVALAKEYIKNYYYNDITLADVANAVYLNPNYFSTLFKKETKVTFIDYLQQYRIEVSKDILKDLHIKINEIPEKIGYKDAKYFVKVFRKIVGITPSEYRKLYT